MSTRTCDSCGKQKPLRGAKTCQNGHFICNSCLGDSVFNPGGKSHCPICKKKLK